MVWGIVKKEPVLSHEFIRQSQFLASDEDVYMDLREGGQLRRGFGLGTSEELIGKH